MPKIFNLVGRLPVHQKRRWKARRKPIERIYLHCTGGTNQDPAGTARYHVRPNHISSKGCPGICYHDFIDSEGTVYHCTEYDRVTWHTKGHNNTSLGVVLAYLGDDDPPPDAQLSAAIEHCAALMISCGLCPSDVLGHREAGSGSLLDRRGPVRLAKTCPGLKIHMPSFRAAVCKSAQEFLRKAGLYKAGLYRGKIDGVWGQKSKSAQVLFLQGEALRNEKE